MIQATSGKRPSVGIISDSPLQRLMLNNALQAYSIEVSVCCEPTSFFEQIKERTEQVHCCVVELDDDALDISEIIEYLDDEDIPFLLGLGAAPPKNEIEYISWERRLLSKLEEQCGSLEQLEDEQSIRLLDEGLKADLAQTKQQTKDISPSQIADEVWVLAASLGGPAAVKEFIDQLPANLGIGFLYAQHVDAHFSAVLTDVLGRHSKLDLVPMQSGRPICRNEIQVVPVDHEVTFEGRVPNFAEGEWPGPYGPSIDQLLINLFRVYGPRCHVIVFSGMGNDGALGVPQMRQAGCEVWTQSPDTCGHYSMPQSVIDLDCSLVTDSPENLAHALVAKYQQRQAG